MIRIPYKDITVSTDLKDQGGLFIMMMTVCIEYKHYSPLRSHSCRDLGKAIERLAMGAMMMKNVTVS